MIARLAEKLLLKEHKLITITGGGGKTSLSYALGNFCAASGKALFTTTTKIFPPSDGEVVNIYIGTADGCIAKLEKLPEKSFTLAAKEKIGDKFSGYAPEETDAIAQSPAVEKVIVEADGSRGLSLKGYEDWEPPVPQATTLQIVVVGADVFISPMCGANVFRFDLLREKYGMSDGEKLSLANFAAIVSNRSGYLKNSPEKARRVLLLNKAELLEETERSLIMKELSQALRNYDAVVLASLRDKTVYGAAELSR